MSEAGGLDENTPANEVATDRAQGNGPNIFFGNDLESRSKEACSMSAQRIDLQVIIEAVVQSVRRSADKAAQSPADFDRGMVIAYHDVLDIIKEQAELLDVPLVDVAMAGFDPDSLLRRRSTS